MIIYNLLSDRQSVKASLFLLLLLFLIMNVMTILGSLDLVKISGIVLDEKYGRTEGAFGEPNQYAAYIVLFIPLAIAGLFIFKSVLARLFAIAVTLTALYALLLTGSRGGLAGLLCGLTALCVLEMRRRGAAALLKAAFVAIAAMVITLGGAFYFLPETSKQGLQQNVIARAEGGDLAAYSSGRLERWQQSIELFLTSPVFGTGWQTLSGLTGHSPHSDFILFLTTTGLIGFALYLWIFYRLLRTALSYRAAHATADRLYYTSYLAGLLSFVVTMVFVNLYSPYYFLFIYSGLILKLGALEPMEKQPESGSRVMVQVAT